MKSSRSKSLVFKLSNLNHKPSIRFGFCKYFADSLFKGRSCDKAHHFSGIAEGVAHHAFGSRHWYSISDNISYEAMYWTFHQYARQLVSVGSNSTTFYMYLRWILLVLYYFCMFMLAICAGKICFFELKSHADPSNRLKRNTLSCSVRDQLRELAREYSLTAGALIALSYTLQSWLKHVQWWFSSIFRWLIVFPLFDVFVLGVRVCILCKSNQRTLWRRNKKAAFAPL